MADALAKNNIAQKKEQEKKHTTQIAEIWDSLELYNKAQEPLIIKRKVTPSGGMYEKVHESDVKEALSQWKITIPSDIVVQKQAWDTTGPQVATLVR
jgi:ribosomal protein L9